MSNKCFPLFKSETLKLLPHLIHVVVPVMFSLSVRNLLPYICYLAL